MISDEKPYTAPKPRRRGNGAKLRPIEARLGLLRLAALRPMTGMTIAASWHPLFLAYVLLMTLAVSASADEQNPQVSGEQPSMLGPPALVSGKRIYLPTALPQHDSADPSVHLMTPPSQVSGKRTFLPPSHVSAKRLIYPPSLVSGKRIYHSPPSHVSGKRIFLPPITGAPHRKGRRPAPYRTAAARPSPPSIPAQVFTATDTDSLLQLARGASALSPDIPITLNLLPGLYSLSQTVELSSLHVIIQRLSATPAGSGDSGSGGAVHLQCQPGMTGPALLLRPPAGQGPTLLLSGLIISHCSVGGVIIRDRAASEPLLARQVLPVASSSESDGPEPILAGYIDVIGCEFMRNSGKSGGALLINTSLAVVNIRASGFHHNAVIAADTHTAHAAGAHAAMVLLSQGGSVLLQGTVFQDNGPHSKGPSGQMTASLWMDCAGAAALGGGGGCNLVLSDSTWASNEASIAAGALMQCGHTDCSVTVSNCTFLSNMHFNSRSHWDVVRGGRLHYNCPCSSHPPL